MAQIEKRHHANGAVTYRARIRIAGMPDISASFSTRSSAKEWARKKETELKESRYFPREESKNRTFSEFSDLYIEKFLIKNPKAFKKQQQLMNWWQKKLGSYFLCHITSPMIAQLRDELLQEITCRGTLRSSSTVNRYLAALSRAFTICIKELGWLKENPVLLITRPPEAVGRDRYLNSEEISRLLETCLLSRSRYLHTIVLFALTTGARKGEILNLKWDDIDWQNSTAIFRKTKNGDLRVVFLNPKLLQALMKEAGRRVVPSQFIFPSSNGQKPADIEGAWDMAVKRSHLPNLRFHDLRHTAASYLAMSGATVLEIAAVLGHRTLAMVKRYSHLSVATTNNALKRMNDSIGIL